MNKIWATPITIGAGGHWRTQPVTLPAADWQGNQAPFSCRVALAGVTGTSVQILAPAQEISADLLFELQEANIQEGGQETGVLTLLAYGKKPENDLPLRALQWEED